MVRIICTLENASEEISGVKFATNPDGMISEDITQDVADGFLAISHGYKLAGDAKKPEVKEESSEDKEARDALVAKANELGLTVNPRWSLKTFADRVAAAEAEVPAADAEPATDTEPATGA